MNAMYWTTPPEKIELGAYYLVKTNDGQFEVWNSHMLYVRQRPEFTVGRAVMVAKITDPAEQAQEKAA